MDRKWFFIVPIFILVLAVAGYFSVKRLFPGGTTTQTPLPVGEEGEFTYSQPIQGDVYLSVSSQSQDYLQIPVSFSNTTYLKGKLSEWKFWDENKVTGFNASGKRLIQGTAKSLNVVIVEQSSATFPFEASDQGTFSVEFDYQTGIMNLYLYLGQGVFESTDAQTLAKRISDFTLTAAYFVTHPDEGIKLQTSAQTYVIVSK